MGLDAKDRLRHIHDTVAPTSRALDQSVQVHDKVKQAADDLASVNAVLKDEMAHGMLAKVELAVDGSEGPA